MRDLILPWGSQYEDYLHDESRRMGAAESISFPMTEAEVAEIVKSIGVRGGTVTTQGARTGLVAGAVPNGGHILNLSRMNRIGEAGKDSIIVQPGAILSDIESAVEKHGLFFPPDPTETSASMGGMVASNASGAKSYFYGATRNWVNSLRLVLSDGDTISLRRGENFAKGRDFSLTTDSGRVISGRLPSYTQPNVKTAASYYVADDMDLIDLFIGSEGTLGIVTEIELRLISKPAVVNGLTVFFSDEDAALAFVGSVRAELRSVAIEFFNHDALELLRRMKSDNPAFEKIPALKPSFHTAVYLEFHGESEEAVEESVMGAMDLMTSLGVSDDDTWFATTEREIEPHKAFRHAIPEAVNLLIDERKRAWPDIAKLGTDMSVPDSQLREAMLMYNSGLAENNLESVIFGHIGNNHLHVNILPHSPEDFDRGKTLYLRWARKVVEMGGSVSAEHGIGKTKKEILELMYGAQGIAQMRALRLLFDSEMMLNRGNLA